MPLNPVTQPQYTPSDAATRTNAGGALERLRLEEPGYLPLYLSPTTSRGMVLQDFDLGKAAPRAVQGNRPLGDGTNDYTKFLGPKSVSLTIMCSRDAYAEPGYYASLVSSWAAPARRPTLVYKLRGMPECSIALRGSQLGAPIAMTANRGSAIALTAQWVGVDGKDYATAQSTANVVSASTVVTYGSADTEPVITAYGPQPAGFTVINDTAEARSGLADARLGFTQAIPDGTFVVVDTKARSAQFGGLTGLDNSWRRYLSPARWFPLVASAYNNLRLENAGSGTVQVAWRDAYL